MSAAGTVPVAPLRRMRSKPPLGRSGARPSPAAATIDVGDAGDGEAPAGAVDQGRETLDRMNAAAETGEQRRHVAGAGADLEHALPALRLERHEHGRDRAGRRHRLPARQRQGHVGARQVGEAARREQLARDALHGAEHAGVADAAGAQGHDESGRLDALGGRFLDLGGRKLHRRRPSRRDAELSLGGRH